MPLEFKFNEPVSRSTSDKCSASPCKNAGSDVVAKCCGLGNHDELRLNGTEIHFDCAGETDVGLKRRENQDQFFIADLHKNMHVLDSSVPFHSDRLYGNSIAKLLLVADGMGGHNAGNVASGLATTNAIRFLLNSMHWLYHPTENEIQNFINDLKSAANFTHEVVCQNAEEVPDFRGMGTTLTMAYLVWPMLYVLHVGDSRCYILSDEKLERITKDQTLAQELADHGYFTDEDIAKSPYQNVLISAIGCQDSPDAIVYRRQLKKGDRILLCSDGITSHLSDEQIHQHLAARASAGSISRTLVATANEMGGSDNSTAVVGICS